MKEHQPINPAGLKLSILAQPARDLKDNAMLTLIDMIESQQSILRSSVPDHFKTATSAVGGAQGYIAELETRLTQTREVAQAALGYIDAIPKDAVNSFPTMPGFSRDWADEILDYDEGKELNWSDYLAISEDPDVDQCMRNFDEDPTEDNAVCMVRSIIEKSYERKS